MSSDDNASTTISYDDDGGVIVETDADATASVMLTAPTFNIDDNNNNHNNNNNSVQTLTSRLIRFLSRSANLSNFNAGSGVGTDSARASVNQTLATTTAAQSSTSAANYRPPNIIINNNANNSDHRIGTETTITRIFDPANNVNSIRIDNQPTNQARFVIGSIQATFTHSRHHQTPATRTATTTIRSSFSNSNNNHNDNVSVDAQHQQQEEETNNNSGQQSSSSSLSSSSSSSSPPTTSTSVTSTTNTATDTLNHGQANQTQQPTTVVDNSGVNLDDQQRQQQSMETSTTTETIDQPPSSNDNNNPPHSRGSRPPVSVTFRFNIRRSGDGQPVNNNHQHHPHPPDLFGNPDLFDANFLRARQRVYSMLLIRIALLYSVSVPKIIRNCFEYLILATALTCFALLIHMHVIFIRSPLTCLDHVKDTWPKHGILRVQIGDGVHGANGVDEKFQQPDQLLMAMFNVSMLPMTYEQYRLFYHESPESTALRMFDKKRRSTSSRSFRQKQSSQLPLPGNHHVNYANIEEDILIDDASLASLALFNYKKNGAWSEPYMVEYSLEYGLLRLSESMREYYNVPVMKVSLNPEVDKCFGDMMARFMLSNFLGYDDVLIGSIKQLAEQENNRGFVRNVITGEHFRFVNVWMTRTSYLAAAFIMIVFTLFVSMLIRYSHQQVFVFVSEFLRSIEMQQPATSRISFLAASLVTVILALIGMETIMYEFFSDSSITFHVIIMVWAADQFDSLAVQSGITRKHFLRFFYLYQFIFYAYHYRFNGQYSGLALLTTMLFTYHSMIYFFHHYELPFLRAAYNQFQRHHRHHHHHHHHHHHAQQQSQPQQQQQQPNQTQQPSENAADQNQDQQSAATTNTLADANDNDNDDDEQSAMNPEDNSFNGNVVGIQEEPIDRGVQTGADFSNDTPAGPEQSPEVVEPISVGGTSVDEEPQKNEN